MGLNDLANMRICRTTSFIPYNDALMHWKVIAERQQLVGEPFQDQLALHSKNGLFSYRHYVELALQLAPSIVTPLSRLIEQGLVDRY